MQLLYRDYLQRHDNITKTCCIKSRCSHNPWSCLFLSTRQSLSSCMTVTSRQLSRKRVWWNLFYTLPQKNYRRDFSQQYLQIGKLCSSTLLTVIVNQRTTPPTSSRMPMTDEHQSPLTSAPPKHGLHQVKIVALLTYLTPPRKCVCASVARTPYDGKYRYQHSLLISLLNQGDR